MNGVKATTLSPFIAIAAAASLLGACGGGNSVESFCDVMEELDNEDPTLGLEEGSPEFFEAVTGSFDRAAEAAPDDIRGDVEALSSAMEEISTLADDPEGNSDRVLEILTEIQTSTENLDTYLETNCESELN